MSGHREKQMRVEDGVAQPAPDIRITTGGSGRNPTAMDDNDMGSDKVCQPISHIKHKIYWERTAKHPSSV